MDKETLKEVRRKIDSGTILENGGAEQETEEWWNAITKTTKELFKKTDIKPSEIAGISFCTQMQGVVLVDKHGNALRRPMSYLDSRVVNEFKECVYFLQGSTLCFLRKE